MDQVLFHIVVDLLESRPINEDEEDNFLWYWSALFGHEWVMLCGHDFARVSRQQKMLLNALQKKNESALLVCHFK